MNIDEDYLWNKTGDVDPEIQELEEILANFRYQPRPLEIPAGVQKGRERSFFRGSAPRLAIAASLAALLLAVGLWLGLQRLQHSQPQQLVKSPSVPLGQPNPPTAISPEPNSNNSVALSAPELQPKRNVDPRRPRFNQMLAGNRNGSRKQAVNSQLLAARKQKEQLEAAAAKDQLIRALRLASAKLNFAQRMTNTNSKDPVQNQHKTG